MCLVWATSFRFSITPTPARSFDGIRTSDTPSPVSFGLLAFLRSGLRGIHGFLGEGDETWMQWGR